MEIIEVSRNEVREKSYDREQTETTEETRTESLSMNKNSQKESESNEDHIHEMPEVQMDVDDGDDAHQSLPGGSGDPSVSESCFEISVIRPIDKNVVHRICSGQVVVTLATAVKELVENSIDAGATNVDIRLTEYGSKSIEVADNGCGVDEANFEGLGLKHHTSKIQVFEDLTCVETFGFRGEALSSLCALSSLTVITKSKGKTKNEGITDMELEGNCSNGQGFRIEYDTKGRISQKTRCAREVGTTVILKNLFSTLPVRHTEFMKNLKREFAKMVNILYGYCLITTGVRISCVNQLESGSMSKVLSVPASDSAKEKIVCLFGSKQLESLVEIKEASQCRDEKIMAEYGLTDAEQKADSPFTFRGYISLPYKGRCSSDRQFYFINSRPCEPTKINRIVNEVYHGYSRSQSPFLFLDIRTQQQNVDVNVTPDKRQIYLRNEKILYASIKETLVNILAAATSTFNLESKQLPTFSSSYMKLPSGTSNSRQDVFSQSSEYNDVDDISELQSPLPLRLDKVDPLLKLNASLGRKSSLEREPLKSPTLLRSHVARNSGEIKDFFKKYEFKGTSFTSTKDILSGTTTARPDRFTGNSSKGSKKLVSRGSRFVYRLESGENRKRHSDFSENEYDSNTVCDMVDLADSDQEAVSSPKKQSKMETVIGDSSTLAECVDEKKDSISFKKCKYYEAPKINCSQPDSQLVETDEDDCIIVYDDEFAEDADVRRFVNAPNTENDESSSFSVYGNAKVVSCSVDWADVKSKYLESSNKNTIESPANEGRRFRAAITLAENKAAEEELKKQLSKDMFQEMKIIGQFNLGFIIVRHGPDIFIVDQHATDEKYNFEHLEKTLVLQSQRLISPMDLQLPSISESILIDNLDVFKKNGFDFSINEDESATRRVKMTQIPYSKSSQFGKEDVEELIFLLEDAPEKAFYRPSKVRDMLASRACRKSVMIGTALNGKEMRRIVDHMGVMDQPWNCPHGRPTVRHLLNLNMIPQNDIFKFNH